MTFKISTSRRSGRWDELPARQLFGRRSRRRVQIASNAASET
jgi:hypothetical protein